MKFITPIDHQGQKAFNLAAGVSSSDAASMSNLASYATLAGASFTNYVLVNGNLTVSNGGVSITSSSNIKLLTNAGSNFGLVLTGANGPYAATSGLNFNWYSTGASNTSMVAGFGGSYSFDYLNGKHTFGGSNASIAAGATLGTFNSAALTIDTSGNLVTQGSVTAVTGAFSGNVTNTSGLVLGGVNTGLATLMVNPTVGATSTSTTVHSSGYTLGQFGTSTPLTINQFYNPTAGGFLAGTVYEIACNQTISGSTRTATQAGYGLSIMMDPANGNINLFASANSMAAGASLVEPVQGTTTNMNKTVQIQANGTIWTSGELHVAATITAPFANINGVYSSYGGQIHWQNPYINIKTPDTGKSTYGIQPSGTGVTPSNVNTYGYTANMSNDPASAATTSLGPTMEFSMFASVYTGNAASKTIVRGSTNSGVIVGNSTNAISGGAVTIFPKLSFGTFGTTTSSSTSNVLTSEFAKFAGSTGNLMLFAPTTMGSDSTQTDSGAKLQVYGTSYFSGATAYGGVVISGVASAEYGTGEVNRQITASATGAGNNYSTWFRGSNQMGSYGYSDTTTDILYLNNTLGNVSINTVTCSTGGSVSVPGTLTATGATILQGILTVTGLTNLNNNVTINGGVSVNSTANVSLLVNAGSNFGVVLTGANGAYPATGGLNTNWYSTGASSTTINAGFGGSYSFDYVNGKHIFGATSASSAVGATASIYAPVASIDYLGNIIASGNGKFGTITSGTATFSGIVTAATAATATNTTQVATTAFVKSAIAAGTASPQTLDQTLTQGKTSTQSATLGSLSLNAAYTVASTTLGINAATGTGTTNATNMAMLGTTVPFTIANFQDHSTLLMGNSYFNSSQVMTTNTAGFSPYIELNAQSGNINFLSQSTSQAANSATSSTYSLTLDKSGNGTFLAGVTATTGTFSGTVTTQTQTAGDNTTNAATTAFVSTAIANVNVAGKKLNYTTFASVASTSSTYSALATDDVISVDMTPGGTQYVSLPTPSNSNLGKLYTVKRLNNGSPSATLTVTTSGGGSLVQSPAWTLVGSYTLQNAGVSGCSITWMSNGSAYELLYMR